MNIFAGARRLGFVFSAIVVVSAVAIVANDRKSVHLLHSSYDAPSVVEFCSYTYTRQVSKAITLNSGKVVQAVNCFDTVNGTAGDIMLPPAKPDGSRVVVGAQAADAIMSLHLEKFPMSDKASKAIEDADSSIFMSWLWSLIWIPTSFALGCWFVMLVVGWIARGFMGIPNGADAKQ